MKMFIMSLSFLSLTLNAATTYEYSCSCVDTGLECDGMENMNVSLTGKKATIDLGSEDWEMNDGFEVKLNPKYVPTNPENKSYSQFKIISGGGGYDFDGKKSSFLFKNTLLKGGKTANVKFYSVSGQDTGGGFYSWLFECTKN